jgi:hypothetical protein
MNRRTIAIGAVLCIACSTGLPDYSDVLLGQWGGVGGELHSSAASAVLSLACAGATLTGPITLQPDGSFAASGSISSSTWDPAVGRLVKIDGRVAGDTLYLSLYDQDLHGEYPAQPDAKFVLLPRRAATYPDGKLCVN